MLRTQEAPIAALRGSLLRWVFSRPRWVNAVLVVGAFGLLFFFAPNATMDFLGVEKSGETAVLFRLYGALLVARAISHHAAFGVPEPRLILRGFIADLVFASVSAGVLATAIFNGLAGPTTWLVVGLFVVESAGYVISYAGLRGVTHDELAVALRNARDSSA
jgi:hypothetical protein